MWAEGSTTLLHVRLRHSPVEAFVARSRLSCLLSSVAFQPRAMPPAALLVVRSMADPLPGRITKELELGATPRAEWEQAMRFELDTLCRAAGRPALRTVSPTAQAVLFADYGELLACLAHDMLHGSAKAWWWESIARRFHSGRPGEWARAWEEHPYYVPAALAYLHQRNAAISVLERISASQAWNLLFALLRDSKLHELSRILSEVLAGNAKEPQPPRGPELQFSERLKPRSAIELASEPNTHDSNMSASPAPHSEDNSQARQPDGEFSIDDPFGAGRGPWGPYVASVSLPTHLGPARRALFGISLLLHHAPHIAFSSTFAAQFRLWLKNELERESTASDAPAHRSVNSNSGARPFPFESSTDSTSVSSINSAFTSSPEQASNSSLQLPPSIADHPSHTQDLSSDIELPDISSSPRDNLRPSPKANFEYGEITRAGGVLYLIHFLREAELLRFDVGLSGWALLELVARCILDQQWLPDLSEDPIWKALEVLDGRETETHPGSGFRSQESYRAPESWLQGLDSSVQYVRFRFGRTETWHPEGFLTLDSQPSVRTGGDLLPLTRSQRQAWRHRVQVRAAGLSFWKELFRFLHFVLPYCRWRLRQALGSTRFDEVLLRTGTIYLSPAHVDLVMDLKEVNMAARLVGLDVDPGWVPELARVIRFHFGEGGSGRG